MYDECLCNDEDEMTEVGLVQQGMCIRVCLVSVCDSQGRHVLL